MRDKKNEQQQAQNLRKKIKRLYNTINRLKESNEKPDLSELKKLTIDGLKQKLFILKLAKDKYINSKPINEINRYRKSIKRIFTKNPIVCKKFELQYNKIVLNKPNSKFKWTTKKIQELKDLYANIWKEDKLKDIDIEERKRQIRDINAKNRLMGEMTLSQNLTTNNDKWLAQFEAAVNNYQFRYSERLEEKIVRLILDGHTLRSCVEHLPKRRRTRKKGTNKMYSKMEHTFVHKIIKKYCNKFNLNMPFKQGD